MSEQQQVWTMPPRPVNAETALRCIRAQHGQIRALLTRAQSVARACHSPGGWGQLSPGSWGQVTGMEDRPI